MSEPRSTSPAEPDPDPAEPSPAATSTTAPPPAEAAASEPAAPDTTADPAPDTPPDAGATAGEAPSTTPEYGQPPPGAPPQWTAPGAWAGPMQAGYQQAGYPPPGQPPAWYGPPGSYGPPPPGAPWPPGATAPWPPGPPPSRGGRRPLWIALAVVGVLVLVVAVVVGVNQFGTNDPDDAVAAAADDLRDWEGITYRGEVRQYGRGDITVDLTTDRNGDVVGTLSRPDGGRAEYARLNGVELFKGEASWWRGDTQETNKVQRLAGVWVRNAASEVAGLSNQISGPEKVASDLQPPGFGGAVDLDVYRETGTREVAGQSGRVLEGIARKVIVSQGSSPTVLAVVPVLAETPLEVSRADPGVIGAIGDRRQIRDSAPDYIRALTEQPKVTAQMLNAAPLCTTPECTATVRVTNTSRFDARGSIQIMINGQSADFETFELGPGQSRDLAVTARNPASDTPGQTVPIRWEAKVTAY